MVQLPPGQAPTIATEPRGRSCTARDRTPYYVSETMNSNATPLEDLLKRTDYRSTGIGSNLRVFHTFRDNTLVVHVSGASSEGLLESFTTAVSSLFAGVRPQFAAIDLTACSSLPSVILAFLVFFQKTAGEHGAKKVVLFGANNRILTVIKLIGMQDFFIFQPTETAMKEWCAKQV